MRRLLIYADSSVVGGCEDREFSEGSLLLWRCFEDGLYRLALSDLTLAELKGAPPAVRRRIEVFPVKDMVIFPDSDEAAELAEEYLRRGIVGRIARRRQPCRFGNRGRGGYTGELELQTYR